MSTRKYLLVIGGAVLLSTFLFILNMSDSNPTSSSDEIDKVDVLPTINERDDQQLKAINVNVSMTSDEFERLREANNRYMMKYDNVTVQLTNTESTQEAYSLWKDQFEIGSASDVMLMNSGWVREFAVKGFLRPADRLNTVDTLSEQPARLLAPLKWNSYLWGIPNDTDPLILVWNKSLLTLGDFIQPPDDWDDFNLLVNNIAGVANEAKAVQFGSDLNELLVWLDIWSSDDEQKSVYMHTNPAETRNDRLRWIASSASLPQPEGTDWSRSLSIGTEMEQKQLLSAIVPWSSYKKLPKHEREKLVIDSSQIQHVWLDSRSYVVSSSSIVEEEAITWIKEMTNVIEQEQSYRLFGTLPAKNSLYSANGGFSESSSEKPPVWWLPVLNDEPLDLPPDPGWQVRRLSWEKLWQQYLSETIDMEMFIASIQAHS
ncbi:MAG: hypothetical protein ACE3K5_10185 [Candidatus Pristimantibacillus sp.]